MRCFIAVLAILLLWTALPVAADLMIGTPDSPPSWVDPLGAVREDWGRLVVRLEAPAGERLVGQHYGARPAVTVTTISAGGPISLTRKAYRSPIWPSPVDVMTTRVTDTSDQPAACRLRVVLPEGLEMGERLGLIGGRAVLAVLGDLQPSRTEREWGCVGGVVAMPGWGKPEGKCDPAFRNIRAGMGGVPIIYRFAVPKGAKRTVVLGLCESHWDAAGRRPLVIYVEGAPKTEVDPIALWARHGPGCLRFDASDVNADGRLEMVVAPHPQAPDKNPILNVIWIFSPDLYVDTNQVLRGQMNAAAEYYVDVGGEKDQSLYDTGTLVYDLELQPRATEEFTFLLACNGGSVPNPQDSAWTPAALRRAAEDVWAGRIESGARMLLPGPLAEQWQEAITLTLMTRVQADGYFVALPESRSLADYSHLAAAQIIGALDLAGYPAEAERMLRIYWDRPVPDAFATFAHQENGQWRAASDEARGRALIVQALARHGLLSRDPRWAQGAWPAIRSGAEWLAQAGEGAPLPTEASREAARALLGVSRLGQLLRKPDMDGFGAKARQLDPEAAWGAMLVSRIEDPVTAATASLVRLRMALVQERGRELWLLSGLDPSWLAARFISAEDLPTEFGPVSLQLRCLAKALQVTVTLSPDRPPESVAICGPTMGGNKPVTADADGRALSLDDQGAVRLPATSGRHRVTFNYP